MKYYLEPLNISHWDLFSEVKEVGHIESFKATKEMQVGEIVFFHVCKSGTNRHSGIYAIGEIVSSQYISYNDPNDKCYGKNTVDIKITHIDHNQPYFPFEYYKGKINNFRGVIRISNDSLIYDMVETLRMRGINI